MFCFVYDSLQTIACIHLKMNILDCSFNSHLPFAEHKSEISELLTTCYINNKYLDIIFICKDNICVQVHKVLLFSISQYLRGIIQNSSDEMIYISLPDFESTIVEILINFLYEGITKVNLLELRYLKELITFLGIRLENCDIKECKPVSVLNKSSELENNVKNVNASKDVQNCSYDLPQIISHNLPEIAPTQSVTEALSSYIGEVLPDNSDTDTNNSAADSRFINSATDSASNNSSTDSAPETHEEIHCVSDLEDLATSLSSLSEPPTVANNTLSQKKINQKTVKIEDEGIASTENMTTSYELLLSDTEQRHNSSQLETDMCLETMTQNPDGETNIQETSFTEIQPEYRNNMEFFPHHEIEENTNTVSNIFETVQNHFSRSNFERHFSSSGILNNKEIHTDNISQQQQFLPHISAESVNCAVSMPNWNNTHNANHINSRSKRYITQDAGNHIQGIPEQRLPDSTGPYLMNDQLSALHSGVSSVSCDQYDRDKRSYAINNPLSVPQGQTNKCFPVSHSSASSSGDSNISVLDIYEKYIENCLSVDNAKKSLTAQNSNMPDSTVQNSRMPHSENVPYVFQSNNKTWYYCGTCRYKFVNLPSFKTHTCFSTWKYKCRFCDVTFNSLKNSQAHESVVHKAGMPY